MTVSTMQCPHCGAVNPAGSAFCQSCGKAMPTGYATGPRVVTATTAGASGVGRELLSDELRKKMKTSSGALLAVAIIQAILGPVMLWMINEQMRQQGMELRPIAYVIVFGIAAAFFGLWIWSRFQPFAASIVGLVLYVSIWLVDIVADPTQIFKGIIVKVIVVAVLIKAIQAGAEYRKLLEQQRREGRM
jgi:hypothetical protein